MTLGSPSLPCPAGLLVVSTRVGGVPEVLPDDMLLLAEPSPEGVVHAMGEAVRRVQAGRRDVWAQHAAVRDMYSWQAIAQRTECVYQAVLRDCSCGGCGAGASTAQAGAAAGSGQRSRGSSGGPAGASGCGACVPRDDGMVNRLRRYHKCGTWFGKICCCVAGERQRRGHERMKQRPCSQRAVRLPGCRQPCRPGPHRPLQRLGTHDVS